MSAELLAVVVAFAPLPALGHGDVHEAIDALTRQIETQPGDAQLRLLRGQLYAADQNWDSAGADFDRALALDGKLVVVDLARGAMLARASRPAESKAALDRFLNGRPEDAPGLAARARVLVEMSEWQAAADDFARAIAASRQPDPSLYIERSAALVRAGKSPDAIRALDDGVARLGPLVTLLVPAIDLDVRAGRTDSALARIGLAMQGTPRKERWLSRRGEILEKAGRTGLALESFVAARAALDGVPPERRATTAMDELSKSIDAGLARLATGK